jgi:hypothetical protein
MLGAILSNTRKIKRNPQVLAGRFQAEVQEQGRGGYFANVRHDAGFPGLKHQSMLECRCKPEIVITKLVG